MSLSLIPERFKAFQKECGSLSDVPSESIDVIITSPPYNVGHKYRSYRGEGYEGERYLDKLSDEEYLGRLHALICGIPRVLKPGGAFIIDIAEVVYWPERPTPWNACNHVRKECEQNGLLLLADYTYRAVKSSDTKDDKTDHSETQHVLVFSRNVNPLPAVPASNPLRQEYVFGRGGRDEACWPPPLVADFIAAFSLQSKVVLDPFTGESLLGLMIQPSGGTFYGYDVDAAPIQRAKDLLASEFSAELIACADSFHEEFEKQPFEEIGYAAILVHDTQAARQPPPQVKMYGSSAEQVKVSELVNEFDKERDTRGLPYLGHVLLTKRPTGYDSAPSIFLYRENHLIRVRFGHTDAMAPADYIRQARLEGKDKDVFDLHCRILESKEPGTFIGFLPVAYASRTGFSALVYLIVVGWNYGPKVFAAIANTLLSRLQASVYPILSRRVATLVGAMEIHAARAATAAIMSRNMSHNLGSHALANFKFFESVGLLDKGEGGSPQGDLQAKKADARGARGRLQAFNQYCQGRLDFIARKLAEEDDKPEPLLLIGDVLMGFMNQQVLLDTLLDDNGFNTENISFHVGVNRPSNGSDCDTWKYHRDPKAASVGSAERTALLQVELHPSPDGTVVDSSGGRWLWQPSQSPPKAEDKLIGLTGGITGAHALYALLENILRNAAKYSGKNRGAGMCLYLELWDYRVPVDGDSKGKDCFLLRIWENQTDDADGRAIVEVRNALSQEVFNPETNAPVSGGHGIHEMRLCAEYLSGGENGLRFPDEPPPPAQPTYPSSHEQQDADYLAFLGSEEETQSPSARLRNRSLRAYRMDKNGRQTLVYELLLPKPLLLGICCVKKGKHCTTCQSEHPNVTRFDTIKELATQDAHFGLILAHDCEEETIRYSLEEIERFHTQLPYRLVIVTRDAASHRLWADEVVKHEATPGKPMPPRRTASDMQPATIPVRRVHVIEHGGMFVEHSDCRCVARLNCDEKDPALIAGVYERWLRAWKGEPPGGRWKLCIGFNRDSKHISNRWAEPLEQNATYGAGLFDIFVATRIKTEGGDKTWLAKRVNGKVTKSDSTGSESDVFPRVSETPTAAVDVLPDAAIVYDNHGAVFEGIRENRNYRVYHKFGVSQLGLYQALETPPKEGVPFVFFLFSLLEGSLLNVLTLDERVADATIRDGRFDDSFDRGVLLPMRNAGIHPLYAFRRDDRVVSHADECPMLETGASSDVIPFLSPNVKVAMELLAKDNSDYEDIPVYEGVRYLEDGIVEFRTDRRKEDGFTTSMWTCWQGRSASDPVPDAIVRVPDAIVIHEGLTDAWSKRHLWKKGEDHLPMYQVVPAVVRTSGRGRQSRELGDVLPFIELSVLSDSSYGSLNKPKLARAVLNATGMPDKGDKTS